MASKDSSSDDEDASKSSYFHTELSLQIKNHSQESDRKSNLDSEKFNSKEKSKYVVSNKGNRNIIGEEEVSANERQKLIRPPLVGQASGSNYQSPIKDDPSIIDMTQEETVYVSSHEYLSRKDFITGKPPEGSSDAQSDARAPTPASMSSLTRPLEWDSGADVGYGNSFDPEQEARMSSLERLALGASFLTRSDPEGTPGIIKRPMLAGPIGSPDAQSTPKNTPNNSDKPDESDERKSYFPLFPEVIIQQKDVSDSDNEVKESDSIKKSTSLDKISESKPLIGPATFPRSQSQNIPVQSTTNKQANKSNSSSSVATVVTKSKANTKTVATQSECVLSDESGSVQTSTNNSFEYMPGDEYENSGKSAASIPDLKQDIARGVQILSEFVKGAGANDTIAKKRLLKKVVDELLEKRYPEDEEWDHESLNNERCVTRRSNHDNLSNKSTPSQHSRDSVLSRMGKCAANGNQSHSSTSKTSSLGWNSSSTDNSEPKIEQVKQNKISSGTIPAPPPPPPPVRPPLKSHSDYSDQDKRNWRIPVTASEREHEYKKSRERTKISINSDLMRYLSSERENQLDWIKKEIQHLSNLKQLLEKHETLQKNLADLKRAKENKEKMRSKSAFRTRKKEILDPISQPLAESSYASSDQNSWHSHVYQSEKLKNKRNASTNTGLTEKPSAKSIAYTITFNDNAKPIETPPPLIADRYSLFKESREKVNKEFFNLNLQDELLVKKPEYVERAESRRMVVAELAAMRELRQKNKNKIIAAAISNGSSSPIPPNPLAVKRVVSQKSMRQLTEKYYQKTIDVKNKQVERKRVEDYKTNRLMAEIFKNKLQRKVLGGKTDFSNSVNVISTY